MIKSLSKDDRDFFIYRFFMSVCSSQQDANVASLKFI